jgi:hypothetical protein
MLAAVTSTAGNLVLAGELTGDFLALDARMGDVLYRFNTGGAMGRRRRDLRGRRAAVHRGRQRQPVELLADPGCRCANRSRLRTPEDARHELSASRQAA